MLDLDKDLKSNKKNLLDKIETEIETSKLDSTIMPTYSAELIHKRGVVGLANIDKSNGNVINGPQFYIIDGITFNSNQIDRIESSFNRLYNDDQRKALMEQGGLPHLDSQYTILGEVVKGIEVLDKILEIGVDSLSRPNQDVRMKVSVLKAPK